MEDAHRKIMALADGELGAAEARAVVLALARSPSLMRHYLIQLSLRRRRFAVYNAKHDEAVPRWLVDVIERTPAGESTTRVVSLKSLGFMDWLRGRYAMPRWSLAAGPALAAVLTALGAWLLVPNASYSETVLAAHWQQAIETTNGGESASLVLTLKPVLTFQAKDQAFCRLYELNSDKEQSRAFACRSNDGTWNVVMQTPPVDPTKPRPATEDGINAAITKRMDGYPLDNDTVKRLMSNNWKLK